MSLYEDFLSPKLKETLFKEAIPVEGIHGLTQIGNCAGLENQESLKFLLELFNRVAPSLEKVLKQRVKDREFLDMRCKAFYSYNQEFELSIDSDHYKSVLGLEDQEGRVVMGPLRKNYWTTTNEKSIAELPDFLKGPHITLFGPPDSAKMCINAMNAYHRKLKEEAPIVEELLQSFKGVPMWGADDEDSKTPLREDLQSAGENLSRCFTGDLSLKEEGGKTYELAQDHLSLPIKRFPGLALPCCFLFYENNPLPLHLYDFALHLFKNWMNPRALVFYVPKLENEEEARYIKFMIEESENMIQKIHPEYKKGTIRLMIVLENPRAIFRTHEIIDELYPYFAGASLGWHDFLASTARLFKEDGNYRIPIKADPDIVIKYIKASHELVANVVGARGGIKVGGMYGILPLSNDIKSDSFQLTLKGYIRDVITQMKRNLNGFWVAHPDFVRLGIAMVEAWKHYQAGNKEKLTALVKALLVEKHQKEVLDFIFGNDIESLDPSNPRFARSLIVADLKESELMANHNLEEVRYNVFQSLQYLTDWLSGNGCVALPAQMGGISVRVMDDLATAERSRWEVWHEIYHKRVKLEDFLQVAFEELTFIRKDLSNDKKIVQVKWDERTSKWYPVAFQLMIKLMTDPNPVEFATELLLPFTLDTFRNATNPWESICKKDPHKYVLPFEVTQFNKYFEACGNKDWASSMAKNYEINFSLGEKLIQNFSLHDIQEAAFFHGDIGESKKTLDHLAQQEQSSVEKDDEQTKALLLKTGKKYKEKFGFKFLISAESKSASYLLDQLNTRFENTLDQEIAHAREALWQIAQKRLLKNQSHSFKNEFEKLRIKHKVKGAQIALTLSNANIENICLGEAAPHHPTQANTFFEIASLSKSFAAAFALEYFQKKGISLDTKVNTLFAKTRSAFRLKTAEELDPKCADEVSIRHLLNHQALNQHYVNGYSLHEKIPPFEKILKGNDTERYPELKVISKPGTTFKYSGGGFLVLEHLLESLEEKSIQELTENFLKETTHSQVTLRLDNIPHQEYAHGFKADGTAIDGTRLSFPAFAAGALGTAEGVLSFLCQLENSFHQLHPKNSISHDTAVQMLFAEDKGSLNFMGAKIGLGIFVAEAGPNKFAIHQGANDGFRCLSLHCFSGPQRGMGLVALCNGELNAVQYIAEVTQEFLKHFKVQGIDLEQYSHQPLNPFSAQNLKQEEVVNRGYKDLIFSAFQAQRPEAIPRRYTLDALSTYNKILEAEVIECSNDKFALAENLISPFEPVFEADLFGAQGKVMDSWESARHSINQFEFLTLKLKKPSSIKYVSVSTKFHLGNQVPAFSLEASNDDKFQNWTEIIPKTFLDGHALKNIKTETSLNEKFSYIKVCTYPDGGLTRLCLFDETLPAAEATKFKTSSLAISETYKDIIPKTKKPLSIPFSVSKDEIENNWNLAKKKKEIDIASSAFGAKILSVSNEHYGPVTQVISPFAPLNMFDGFESARSREKNHFEVIHLQLAKIAKIDRIEFNFKYFLNNNPLKIRIEGLSKTNWIEIVEISDVKAYQGNQISFVVKSQDIFSELRIYVYPDGGINRLKVLSKSAQ